MEKGIKREAVVVVTSVVVTIQLLLVALLHMYFVDIRGF